MRDGARNHGVMAEGLLSCLENPDTPEARAGVYLLSEIFYLGKIWLKAQMKPAGRSYRGMNSGRR